MVTLTDLPEEILIMIVREFDLYTLESVYNTCKHLRNIICLHGVIKEMCMSRNIMATANNLKSDLFKDIAHNLLVVNMSGVPDLNKTVFISALKKLKNLKVLDVSYTNVHIADLLEIHKICPALKDITINLSCNGCAKVSNKVMMKCQSVFEHFENIHLIGGVISLLTSKLALYLVAKSTLDHLKFSVASTDCMRHFEDQDNIEHLTFPHFNRFSVYILNWYLKQDADIPVMDTIDLDNYYCLSLLEFEKYSYIIICTKGFKSKVNASAMFGAFFKEKFQVIINSTDKQINLFGSTVVMMWNKETTNFDNHFYDTLLKHVKEYMPHHFVLNNESTELSDPSKRDWFYTVPIAQDHTQNKYGMSSISRKRQAVPNYVLNYDTIFKERHKVKLTVDFQNPITSTIALSSNCNYLRKLTFLSLIGLGRFSADFFNILFQCCVNLVTLNVQTLSLSPCTLAISRSIAISSSLKNIRVVHKRVDMKALFSSFSQCSNLENIHIVDVSLSECNNLADPSALIEKCDHLYSIYLEALLTDLTKRKIMQMCNKAKAKYNKPHIHVMLQNLDLPNPHVYDPFIDVFRLNSVRPL